MNHRIPSSFAATLSTFALAAVVVAGCGQAFSLTKGTSGSGSGSGGSGGEGTTSGTTTASVSASSATTGSTSASSSSATSSGSGMLGCNWSPGAANPCPMGQYCDDTTCGKTVGAGTCKSKFVNKPGDAPVCGCDGLTYWNGSVAGSHGMPTQHDVACPVDIACSDIKACPAGTNVYCRKANKGCSAAFAGACWVLPSDCNFTSSQVETCPLKDCVNECDLIKQGGSFDNSCGG